MSGSLMSAVRSDAVRTFEQLVAHATLPAPFRAQYTDALSSELIATFSSLYHNGAPLDKLIDVVLGALGGETAPADRDALLAVLPVAVPTAVLATRGGDDRLHISKETGGNKYHSAFCPTPSCIPRSSTTASTPSTLAYDGADRARDELVASAGKGTLSAAFATRMAAVRARLAATLDTPGGELVLCPSGSDAELLPLLAALARARTRGSTAKVCNIVTCAGEVGSGTAPAAGGRHFSNFTPFADVTKGDVVAGLEETVDVVQVAPREASGVADLAAQDATVAAAVDRAVAAGQQVIVHLVHASKTGLHIPSETAVLAMQRKHGDAVLAVVDACQVRCTNAAVKQWVTNGWSVLVTGSKFYGGMPFSGAVIFPKSDAEMLDGAIASNTLALPAGVHDYLSSHEVPPTMPALRAALRDSPNYGLLLRWESALAEMEAYNAIAPDTRTSIIGTWVANVTARVQGDALPNLKHVASPAAASFATSEGGVNSVISFSLHAGSPPAAACLTVAEGKKLHKWLTLDMSARLPTDATDEERAAAKPTCLIGQPVKLSSELTIIRTSIGAALVREISEDDAHGMDKALRDDDTVLRKVQVLARHFPALVAAEQ